ncbi:MAG: MBL fold metallo-hydrolase [Eggerthellaceae bacterium]|jgi:glyoxylase-like metal-dependent hydrolase (beta-lactamase superfamily II)
MKWRAPGKRPYFNKYDEVPLECNQGWFSCYELPGNIYTICEDQHFQEVNSFLIIGTKRALLLDTGLGFCDIKAVVDELYRGDLEVVNCHRHFDHTGNNWRFPEINVPKVQSAIKQAETGIYHGTLANQTSEDFFLYGYPRGFNPTGYCVPPYSVRVVEDGHLFDLGNRKVELVYTPGHTEDHCMLYDHKENVIFGGDMLYFGNLYAHFNNDVMGYSSVTDYIASLEKIKRKFPRVTKVYESHHNPILPASCIDDIYDAFLMVRNGEATSEPLPCSEKGYYHDPAFMKKYEFGKFRIITR